MNNRENLKKYKVWGSEVSAAVCADPNMDPIQLMVKISTRYDVDREKMKGENEKNGIKYEHVALEHVKSILENKYDFKESRTFYPKENPELSCARPDGLLHSKTDQKKLEAIIEIKIPGGEMYKEVPEKYIIQMLYQMHCSGCDHGYFFASKIDEKTEKLDETVKPLFYVIYKSEASMTWINERLRYFIECLLVFCDERKQNKLVYDTEWVKESGPFPKPPMHEFDGFDEDLMED